MAQRGQDATDWGACWVSKWQRPVPSLAQLAAAERVASELEKVASVRRTQYAVYAFGVEAWVCPWCLTATRLGEKRMPMAPASCLTCGEVLQS